jgi:hypothetical protein
MFYLGAHHPHWLEFFGEPLMVSRRWLAPRKSLPKAAAPWVLDSGGFTELGMHGRWTVDEMGYSTEVRGFSVEVGQMRWAACLDWMCEPVMIHGGRLGKRSVPGTKLSVLEHQRRTVGSYKLLRQLAPDLPWLPVIQGWEFDEYMTCVQMYGDQGVDLAKLPAVGLGSVCRRQDTLLAEDVIRELHSRGIKVHAFGFKVKGLKACANHLASADSMAWSYDAFWSDPLPECVGRHKTCANCPVYAARWRDRVMRLLESASCGTQGVLFGEVYSGG